MTFYEPLTDEVNANQIKKGESTVTVDTLPLLNVQGKIPKLKFHRKKNILFLLHLFK